MLASGGRTMMITLRAGAVAEEEVENIGGSENHSTRSPRRNRCRNPRENRSQSPLANQFQNPRENPLPNRCRSRRAPRRCGRHQNPSRNRRASPRSDPLCAPPHGHRRIRHRIRHRIPSKNPVRLFPFVVLPCLLNRTFGFVCWLFPNTSSYELCILIYVYICHIQPRPIRLPCPLRLRSRLNGQRRIRLRVQLPNRRRIRLHHPWNPTCPILNPRIPNRDMIRIRIIVSPLLPFLF